MLGGADQEIQKEGAKDYYAPTIKILVIYLLKKELTYAQNVRLWKTHVEVILQNYSKFQFSTVSRRQRAYSQAG